MKTLINTMPRQRGLTLVELMVALVLGMLVMVGVIQLFVGNKQTYRAQDGLARLQETGRFALFIMNKDLRAGGNLGCGRPELMEFGVTALSVPDEINPHKNYIQGVSGHNDVSGNVTISGSSITPTAGTDVVSVRGVSPIQGIRQLSGVMSSNTAAIPVTQPQTGLAGSHYLNINEGDLLFIADCEKGDIFRASSTPTDTLEHALQGGDGNNPSDYNSRTDFKKRYGQNALITKLRANTYYVAPAGRTYDGQAVSALHRVDMSGNSVELVEGVEDMQVLYGIDGDANKVADRYVTANNVSDWAQVVTIKVYLLVNSVARATDTVADYLYSPKGDGYQTPAGENDRRLRREFSFVTSVRNHTL
jgi:type IV pilus assembly protein PilW